MNKVKSLGLGHARAIAPLLIGSQSPLLQARAGWRPMGGGMDAMKMALILNSAQGACLAGHRDEAAFGDHEDRLHRAQKTDPWFRHPQ